MADKVKRTLEFRMSKKVAELTQVVHMLFTRNHEKEVEIDALKESYEDEITHVIEDGRTRIGKLENKVVELERKLERERNKQTEIIKEVVAQETSDKEDEWRRKLVAAEKALNDEKQETQNLRDLLINAQKDIEKLRQKVEEQLNSKTDEIQRREAELSNLRKQVSDLERSLQTKQLQANETIKNLERNNDKLEKECLEMQLLLDETHKVKESLISRVKLLESELRSLRKDFQKKVSDVVQQNQVVKIPRTAPVQQSFSDYNDELEKLRAEVRRYRLELQNRDNNFNRVFTEHQPLIIDPKAGMIGVNSSQVLRQSTPTHTHISALAVQGKERSFSYDIGQGFEETRRPSSRISTSSSSSIKLPSMSADQRARLTKLMKPRPPSKEMLYSK
ncbi:cytoskeletal protein Sojo-like [Ruditapes philippinarum]|uniref:cytoskeletal protein Sojo-like n=1 Tax=Ruditapes philippinarum TaxID=129788 RepID=UPI00295C242F|nr:cytoskeletal protein Sojo-like [Ruditapes philippinarum]XP_060564735.1 cytoskeletal protein Sojo-like [Ruditapes philippinarum]